MTINSATATWTSAAWTSVASSWQASWIQPSSQTIISSQSPTPQNIDLWSIDVSTTWNQSSLEQRNLEQTNLEQSPQSQLLPWEWETINSPQTITDINLSDLRGSWDQRIEENNASENISNISETKSDTDNLITPNDDSQERNTIPDWWSDVVQTSADPSLYLPDAIQGFINPDLSSDIASDTAPQNNENTNQNSSEEPFVLDIDLSNIQLDEDIVQETGIMWSIDQSISNDQPSDDVPDWSTQHVTNTSVYDTPSWDSNTDTNTQDLNVQDASLQQEVQPITSHDEAWISSLPKNDLADVDNTITQGDTATSSWSISEETPTTDTVSLGTIASDINADTSFDISQFAIASSPTTAAPNFESADLWWPTSETTIDPTQWSPALSNAIWSNPVSPNPIVSNQNSSIIASELDHDHVLPGINSNVSPTSQNPIPSNTVPGGINIDAMLGSLGTTVEQLQPAPITLITQQPLLVSPQNNWQNTQQIRIQAFSMNNIYKIIFILLIASIWLWGYYSVTNPIEFELLVGNILGATSDEQSATTTIQNNIPDSWQDQDSSTNTVWSGTDTSQTWSIDTNSNNTSGSDSTSGSNSTPENSNTTWEIATSNQWESGSNTILNNELDEILKPEILQDQWNERIAAYLIKVKEVIDTSRLQKNKEAAKQSITLQKSLQQLQQTIESDTYDAQKINNQLNSFESTLAEIKALLNDPLNQDEKTL